LSIANGAPEIPTLEDLRDKLAMLSDQISGLSGSALDKATAQARDRPLWAVLVALGIGLIVGYLLTIANSVRASVKD
jgi:ElaB/YqjD/DUF883 family membrane-anchored ribosome-binding protein